MINQEIERRVDAYRGNPQALMQRYQQSQQLIDLLALQKLKSDKEAAMRQMQLAQGQQGQPPTVAQQREQEVTDMTRQEVVQQVGQLAQAQQQAQQQKMQQLLKSGIAQAPGAQTAAQPQAMAAGGIVAFQKGGYNATYHGKKWDDLEPEFSGGEERQLKNLFSRRDRKKDPETGRPISFTEFQAKAEQEAIDQGRPAQAPARIPVGGLGESPPKMPSGESIDFVDSGDSAARLSSALSQPAQPSANSPANEPPANEPPTNEPPTNEPPTTTDEPPWDDAREGSGRSVSPDMERARAAVEARQKSVPPPVSGLIPSGQQSSGGISALLGNEIKALVESSRKPADREHLGQLERGIQELTALPDKYPRMSPEAKAAREKEIADIEAANKRRFDPEAVRYQNLINFFLGGAGRTGIGSVFGGAGAASMRSQAEQEAAERTGVKEIQQMREGLRQRLESEELGQYQSRLKANELALNARTQLGQLTTKLAEGDRDRGNALARTALELVSREDVAKENRLAELRIAAQRLGIEADNNKLQGVLRLAEIDATNELKRATIQQTEEDKRERRELERERLRQTGDVALQGRIDAQMESFRKALEGIPVSTGNREQRINADKAARLAIANRYLPGINNMRTQQGKHELTAEELLGGSAPATPVSSAAPRPPANRPSTPSNRPPPDLTSYLKG